MELAERIAGVVFDLDNTLIHLEFLPEDFIRSVLSPIYSARSASGQDLKSRIRKAFLSKPFSELKTEFGLTEEEFATAVKTMKRLAERAASGAQLYEDAIPALIAIKNSGVSMALLTRGIRELQDAKINKCDLRRYFGMEVYIDDISIPNAGLGKKTFLHNIALRWRYEHSQLLVVGDDPDSELKAAQELGMSTLQIRREAFATEVEKYPSIRSLSEILSHL
jgi:putative hydrolase of the HAD superfamily